MSIFVYSFRATGEIHFSSMTPLFLYNMLLRSDQVSANGFGQQGLGANIKDYKRRYGDLITTNYLDDY